MDRQQFISEIERALDGIKTGPPEHEWSHIWWFTVCALELYGTKWRKLYGPKRQGNGRLDSLAESREELISLLEPILSFLGTASDTDCALILRGLGEVTGGALPELFDPDPLSDTKPRRSKYERLKQRWQIERMARIEVERGKPAPECEGNAAFERGDPHAGWRHGDPNAARSLDEARLKVAGRHGVKINLESFKRAIKRDRAKARVTKK